MPDTTSSPARGPDKVTYAGRSKRRRSTVDKTYKDSGGASDGESTDEETPASGKKMAARTPKKVDVHLPGPSPKRGQTETPSQTASAKKPASTKAKKGMHSRSGSVASLAREDTLDASELSPMKPLSTANTKPRSQIQRADTDDGESAVGEKQGRYASRKSQPERRQFLEDDPNSGDVEAHRVYCKACNQWIELNPTRKYIMKNWVEHRRQCKNASERSESPTKEKEAEAEVEAAPVTPVKPAPAPIGDIFNTASKRIKNEDDRKAIIENDPLSGEVKPDTVYCKNCQTWVKLSKDTRYSLHPWRLHVQKCSGAVPGTRVATAQRKLYLINDPQVKAFTNLSVECKECDKDIQLESKLDYDLTKWEEHKAICVPSAPPAKPAVATALRSPPSLSTTEDTLVPTDGGTPKKGTKRSREEDDIPDRAVRQRSATYEAPQGDAPGFLDWITTPIKNFLRDFRAGLSG